MSAGSIFGGSGGFGSPTSQPQQQQQQSSMFGGGVFAQSENSQPTFTSSAFGLGARAAASNPSFGSGPTFGSPKGFGTFGSNVQAPAFVSPTKGNNLFESLGASENAMTFGKYSDIRTQSKFLPSIISKFILFQEIWLRLKIRLLNSPNNSGAGKLIKCNFII